MQNRKRDTDVQNRLLDSVGEGKVGCFERTASKHVYYLGWNRSPAQVGCMRQVLRPGALGRPRGIGRRGRWEGGSGWGIHVTPWLIHVNVWQNLLQCCEVISLQLIKINEKKIKLTCLSYLKLVILKFTGIKTLFQVLHKIFYNRHFACMCAKLFQSCPSLCNRIDCSPSGSSVHGFLQTRILEWVAMPSSRGSSPPGIEPVSPALAAGFFTTGKPQ